jgi:hypothetical protein
MWYYAKNGMQFGPVSQEELSSKLKCGEIQASALIWSEGMTDWKPLSQVTELMGQENTAVSPGIPNVFPDSSLPSQTVGGSASLPQPPAFNESYLAPHIPTYIWQTVVALVISVVLMMLICLP